MEATAMIAPRPGRPRRSESPTTVRREDGWLKRVVELKETAATIALDCVYSIRTIQLGIKAARQRQAAREARGEAQGPDVTPDDRCDFLKNYGRSKDPVIRDFMDQFRTRPGRD